MIGAFKGGTFRSIDRTVELKDTNKLMVFDPRKPHLTELFSGTRYAITYSYNPATKELSTSDRMRAISPGFNLTPSLGNLVTPDRATSSTDTVDPLLASPGTEHCLMPPETNPNAEETVDPLLPSFNLTIPWKQL